MDEWSRSLLYIPLWACKNWGNWEHDWLDCPECLEAYEKWNEEKEES